MITVENLRETLLTRGFIGKSQNLTRTWGAATIEVDLRGQAIHYPEAEGLKVNDRTTCNFSAPENFVVLDCVIRLLDKGYKPQHIELEPRWQLGRGASGGRADILVKHGQGAPLLLIECKTPGTEFRRAWAKTLQDGDQLFSYAQQISETQFLCLYTVALESGELRYTSHVIAHRDNERYLKDNPHFKPFSKAGNVKERHAVWRDTYKLDFTTKGIFEPNIEPYQIGKSKYTVEDLAAITAADQQGKYHEFATILRQHNVSGRENAFDKLVNLFLCKLVDELEHPDDLRFYWKGVAYDTHFDLLDRLQQLYQAGMERFLGEKITYINERDVNSALRYVRRGPDAMQRAVWSLFRKQKFFTNNDFSLIDVHNERLFYQNAEVLLRIIRMWQDIKLSSPGQHNQFLGDMFEGFLDQGVKQSEGQFFTPMPICRFIVMSLPLEQMVKGSSTPPKAIDYACGAGHFLTELALQLEPLVKAHKPKAAAADYHRAIFGVEKEYRLSKVAKVSAFMYGHQDIRICHGDALIRRHEAYPEIEDGTFDLLVANPPFSVKGFLETLPESERPAYSLTDTIDKLDTANSIETFFLERAKQLLKAGGVAAIILPSSVLSNANGTYVRAREILLQYFDIVAIVEFGSGTFGKTGTNTVTLFLRRKATAPDTAAHYRERVDEWFRGCEADRRKAATYRDAHLVDAYAAHIGVPPEAYRSLLRGEADGEWTRQAHFEVYRRRFSDSAGVDKLHKQKAFRATGHEAQQAELARRFLEFVQGIERDKLYHFVMASDQKHPVLVVRSPTESKAQRQFLGYDWSEAKGGEGIRIMRGPEKAHATTLYDELDAGNESRISAHIRHAFAAKRSSIPSVLAPVARWVELKDLLQFSRDAIDKAVVLGAVATYTATSYAHTKPLHELATVEKGITYAKSDQVPGPTKSVVLTADNVTLDGRLQIVKRVFLRDDLAVPASKRLRRGDILVCMASGSREHLGKLARVQGEENYIAGGFMGILRCKPGVSPTVLFETLNLPSMRSAIRAEGTGSNIQNLSNSIGNVLVPTPDAQAVAAIESGCTLIDKEVAAAMVELARCREQISHKVGAVFDKWGNAQAVSSLATTIDYGLSKPMNESGTGYKIFRMNEIVDRRVVDGGAMKCIDISAEEFAKYRLDKGDLLFNRTNGSIEQVGKVGLFDLDGDYCFASYLVRVKPDPLVVLPKFLCLMMNSDDFRRTARNQAVKSAGQININATKMRAIKVPVPTLKQQQKLVDQVDELEHRIAQARAVIDGAPARKQAILDRHLG
jgi:type I restriction enzyme M protein